MMKVYHRMFSLTKLNKTNLIAMSRMGFCSQPNDNNNGGFKNFKRKS